MEPRAVAFVLVTAAAVGILLVGYLRNVRFLQMAAKTVASAAFLVAAMVGFQGGTVQSWAGVALVCCFVGDVLLLGTGWRFVAGLGAFLVAHLAFAVAFASLEIHVITAAAAGAVLALVAWAVVRWLGHRTGKLAAAVAAYMFAIAAMVALALATWNPTLAAGAILFAASDLAVARHRFVAPGVSNKLWGLPLYYAAQAMFVLSLF